MNEFERMETVTVVSKTVIGYLAVTVEGDAVTAISYRGDSQSEKKENDFTYETCQPYSEQSLQGGKSMEKAVFAIGQLHEYLSGNRKEFTFPIRTAGTAFQERVWAALREIPYGETRSYGQIAAASGNAKAYRAVGMANNRNPLMIVTPCHRVVGSDGNMVGYACGIRVKEYLLELEKGHINA